MAEAIDWKMARAPRGSVEEGEEDRERRVEGEVDGEEDEEEEEEARRRAFVVGIDKGDVLEEDDEGMPKGSTGDVED